MAVQTKMIMDAKHIGRRKVFEPPPIGKSVIFGEGIQVTECTVPTLIVAGLTHRKKNPRVSSAPF